MIGTAIVPQGTTEIPPFPPTARADARAALSIIDNAIDTAGTVLGDIGAVVNRFD